jgi:hypothetical protein
MWTGRHQGCGALSSCGSAPHFDAPVCCLLDVIRYKESLTSDFAGIAQTCDASIVVLASVFLLARSLASLCTEHRLICARLAE